MTELLRSIPTALLMPLLVLVGTVPAVLVLFLVRRRCGVEFFKVNHDATGAIFNVIGVLYTVLLAFVMVTVWERYSRTEEFCEAEANHLADMHRASYMLPEADQPKVREAIIQYAHVVEQKEWESMIHRRNCPEAVAAMDNLWKVYYSVKPKTGRESLWYQESVDELNEMADDRRLRIMASKTRVNWVMWTLLFVGGVMTLGYMNFFGMESFRVHVFMTVSLGAMLILILFVIYSLDNPFWGDPHISAEPFLRFLQEHPEP
jgi:hypothetical protein